MSHVAEYMQGIDEGKESIANGLEKISQAQGDLKNAHDKSEIGQARQLVAAGVKDIEAGVKKINEANHGF